MISNKLVDSVRLSRYDALIKEYIRTHASSSSYSNATQSSDGLMSSVDKTKLDGLSNYSVATQSSDGLMSSTDKVAVDKIGSGSLNTTSQTIVAAINELKAAIAASSLPNIVSWGGGTDAEVAAMIQAHYQGLLNLADYWQVGDVRSVTLNSIPGTNYTFSPQALNLRLVHAGDKTLRNAINGHSTCAFVVDCAASLEINYGNGPIGLNYSESNITTLSEDFYNSLPSGLKSIFKQFLNWNYAGTSKYDIFSLYAEKELFGTTSHSMAAEASNTVQFSYFNSTARRQCAGSVTYWLRSGKSSSSRLTAVTSGTASSEYSTGSSSNRYGLRFFGVI